MQELEFNQGMLLFSHDSYEMKPCLSDAVPCGVQSFYVGGYGLTETHFSGFGDVEGRRDSGTQSWVHVWGVVTEEFWEGAKECLRLTEEQVKLLNNPHKGAYFADFPNGIFWSLQRPFISEDVEAIETVNFFLSNKVLLTRQFSDNAVFAPGVQKLMARGDRIEHMTADLLAQELIDDLLDSYVQSLKFGGTKLEDIQNKIIRNPGKEELNLINRAQQVIWIYLNAIWPVETVLHQIARSKNPVLSPLGREELAHRQEQAAAVVRLFETYRQMSYNLMDVYVSGIGLKTNETTAVLTIIATLFLPPTLIAGIYGMNFQIPEYHAQYGYYACLLAMFLVSGGLLVWLKSKGFIDF